MKRHLLPLLAALLLLTGCTTQPETTPVAPDQSQSGPDLSVPSWKTGRGWLSRYIISGMDGQPLECVVYENYQTGTGGVSCNWGHELVNKP